MSIRTSHERELNNAQEHLRVIRADLNVVAQDIKDKSEELLEIKKSLSVLEKALNEKEVQYKELVKKNEILLTHNNALVLDIEENSALLHKLKDEIVTSEVLLEKAKSDFESKLSSLDIRFKQSVKESLEETAKITKHSLEVSIENKLLVENKNKLIEEITNIENELQKKKDEKEALLVDFERFVKNSEQEKQKIQKEIEEEKNKIAIPMSILDHREREVARVEKNIKILRERFIANFKKYNPGLDPKI